VIQFEGKICELMD